MAIATQFLTGFEHGFIGTGSTAGGGLFDGLVGTANWSASTSSPRNGSYCAHAIFPGSTVTSIRKTSSGTKQVMRVGVKVSTRPSSGAAGIIFGDLVATGISFGVKVSSTGVLSAGPGITAPTNGPTIDTASWHLLELQVDTVAGTLDWKVDGVLQTRVTGITVAVDNWRLGTSVATDPACVVDYDDLIFGTWTNAATDWYGDGKVLGHLAVDRVDVFSSIGATTNFSVGEAGAFFTSNNPAVGTGPGSYVDDPPGTGGWTATRSTTDNLAMRAAVTTNYLAVGPVLTAETGSANAVRALLSYSSVTATANLAACDVRNSAGVVTELWGLTGGVGKDFSESTNFFKGAIVTTPAAGWTAAQVNAIRWRFGGCTSVDINPVPTVQALMLEVDWPVAVIAESPLDETSIDNFNRTDGPVYSGAGASVWETFGGVANTTQLSGRIVSNQLAREPASITYATSKVQLDSSFDLLIDVAVAPSGSFPLNIGFGITEIGTSDWDGWWLSVPQVGGVGTWLLDYYVNGSTGSSVASGSFSHTNPVSGSTIWIAKRGTVITVGLRRPGFVTYNQVLTVDDSRSNVAGPFVFNIVDTTMRLDNLRGGPLWVPSGPSANKLVSVA